MHVGLITYQRGHLKTFQLLQKLLLAGHHVTLFAFPFQLRPQTNTTFADRPHQIINLDISAFCRRHGIPWRPVEGWGDNYADALGEPGTADAPDLYMTCIAKIIPASFITGRTILNAHPGLLPQNRGVDAFKWSIVNCWPIGATLHVIDEAIDRGTILKRLRIPVLPDDTLESLCARAYDLEIDLMANFDRFLDRRHHNWCVGDSHPLSKGRVPADVDRSLQTLFLERRDHLVALATDLAALCHVSES